MPVMAVNLVGQYQLVLPEVRPEVLGLVREVVRVHLRIWRKGELADSAVLGVTELLTNVMVHVGSGCELLVCDVPGGVFVSVVDYGGGGLPRVKYPTTHQTNGRGLALLSALVDEWDIEALPLGSRVWFALSDPALACRQR
jgi:anti-sigma regulatory factor (Ser/Thr protein kinase)